jgi:hypothetical protein
MSYNREQESARDAKSDRRMFMAIMERIERGEDRTDVAAAYGITDVELDRFVRRMLPRIARLLARQEISKAPAYLTRRGGGPLSNSTN